MKKNGFTLIELLVVIAILGIIMAVSIGSYRTSQRKGRDAQRKHNLREVKTSLMLYYNAYDAYPENDGSGNIIGCGDPVSTCDWGARWERSNVVFMKKLPEDPRNIDPYIYTYTQDGNENFFLVATLENEEDPDAGESQAQCGTGSGSQYVVCAE